MTSQEIRAFVDRHVQAWTDHDVRALVGEYAEECELVSPLFRTVRGKAGIEVSYRDLFRTFPDLSHGLDDLLIDHEGGDRIAYVTTGTGTQQGEILGFPASGRRFEIRFVFLLRLEAGQIVSEQRFYDFTGLLLQLGILKAKAG